MYPATIRRYAHLPLPLVESVIAYARTRPYRDLAGLVATLLWSHLEDGWTPPTPAPARIWTAPAVLPCPDWVEPDRWLAWPQAARECLGRGIGLCGALAAGGDCAPVSLAHRGVGITRLEARHDSSC